MCPPPSRNWVIDALRVAMQDPQVIEACERYRAEQIDLDDALDYAGVPL